MTAPEQTIATVRFDAAALCPRRLNHAAFIAKDAADTVDFYTRVMGMEFVSGLVDDRVPSTGDDFPYFHIFFAMEDGSLLAFFVAPGLPEQIKQHPAFDIFNHFAMHCESTDEVRAWKERLESHGVDVLGPIDHNGELYSIYFYDPNGIRLEMSAVVDPHLFARPEEARAILKDWTGTVEAARRQGRDVSEALVEHIRNTRSREVKRG